MPSNSLNYRNVVLVGICLPAFLACADRLILSVSVTPKLSAVWITGLFGICALQIAFVSWALGKFIAPWPLRWFIWLWTMALIDLQLAVISAVENSVNREAIQCLGTGVLAGQLGALIVWGILGNGPLVGRLPSLLILPFIGINLYGLLVRTSQDGSWNQLDWADLLWLQATVLGLLCLAVRLCGFVLEINLAACTEGGGPGPANQRLQFGIRDVLIGTTSLAIALAIAKAGDLLTLKAIQNLYAAGFFFVVLIATCTAAVLLVALWAALGRGRTLFMALLVILASLALGAPIAWYCINVGQPQMMLNRDYRLYHWYATGYWWLGWMFLTGTLLASLLIIYRTLGYRLVRQSPGHFKKSFPSEVTSPSKRIGKPVES